MHTPSKKFLRKKRVAQRYGVCTRTVDRWRIKGLLPPADIVVNGQEAWAEDTLENNERQRLGANRAQSAIAD